VVEVQRAACSVVADEVRRAAVQKIASLGPRLVAQVMRSSGDMIMPATASGLAAGPLSERARHGSPLTALADASCGQDAHLGSWGLRPASVGDLVEARGTDGSRVATELRRQCALEAARMAPGLADELASRHHGLAAEVAHAHGAPLVAGRPGADHAAVLCAEVAALLTIELLAVVEIQMGDAPLPVLAG
jgi:hypothetical protein